jgi:hypothetical protein
LFHLRARFDTTGFNWYRVDGAPLAPSAAALLDPATERLETALSPHLPEREARPARVP